MENLSWQKWTKIISFFEIILIAVTFVGFLGVIGLYCYHLYFQDDVEKVWIWICLATLLIVGTLIFKIKLGASNGLRTAADIVTVNREVLDKAYRWQIATIIFAALDIPILIFLISYKCTVPAIIILFMNLYRASVLTVNKKFVKGHENSASGKPQSWRLWARYIAITELILISIFIYFGILAFARLILELRSSEKKYLAFASERMLWIFSGGIAAFDILSLISSIRLLQSTNRRMNPDDAFGKLTFWRTTNLTMFYLLILMLVATFVSALSGKTWSNVFALLVFVFYRALALNIVAIFANELEQASDSIDEEGDEEFMKQNSSDIKRLITITSRNQELTENTSLKS